MKKKLIKLDATGKSVVYGIVGNFSKYEDARGQVRKKGEYLLTKVANQVGEYKARALLQKKTKGY
jgi:hypothetical protein